MKRIEAQGARLLDYSDGRPPAASQAHPVAAAILGAWTQTLSVGASIGFAMLGPSDELSEVLARADHAMYARKGARKSRLPSVVA